VHLGFVFDGVGGQLNVGDEVSGGADVLEEPG